MNNPSPAQIRKIREDNGLSVIAAAELISATVHEWQSWEAGSENMHPGLWKFFNVKIKAKKTRHVFTKDERQRGIEKQKTMVIKAPGVPNKPGPSAKGPEHYKAKTWSFINSSGETLSGKNLNDLIRKNAHLFSPEDVIWRGPSNGRCNAESGLRSLTKLKKDGSPFRLSWKGWRIK